MEYETISPDGFGLNLLTPVDRGLAGFMQWAFALAGPCLADHSAIITHGLAVPHDG